MKSVSTKTAKRNREYARKARLYKLTHPNCEIMWDDLCSMQTTEVDHVINRKHLTAEQFLDERNWQGACHHCHHMKTTHPDEARERGLAAKSWEWDAVVDGTWTGEEDAGRTLLGEDAEAGS